MGSRSFVSASALALLLALAPLAGATAASFPEETPFSESAFEAAQKAEKPILVHITAPWCTTCAAQKPIVDRLLKEPRFSTVKVFNVDFDNQKSLVHRFKARMQSTLIVFKGHTEEGRSTGETSAAPIAALLDKAV